MRKLGVFLLLAIVTSVLGTTAVGCGSPKLSTSANPSSGGSVAPSGGTYQKGVTVGVTAAPASGYRFDRWEGGASGTSPTVQVVMDSNRNLIAYFTIVHTLSASASPTGGGTVTPSSETYDAGEQVAVIAAPAKYYRFNGWAGDASGASDRITITMDSDKRLAASFVKMTYTLQTQVDSSGGGTVEPSGSGTYEAGTQKTITATAAPGYRFDHWSGDVSGKTNPTTAVVERDMKVTANLIRVHTLAVSSSPNDGGTIDIDPNGPKHDAGTKVNLSATPLFPYYVKNWTGADDNSVNPTTVTMKGDASVTAVFERLVAGPQKKAAGAVSNDPRWGPVASIPVQLNKDEWVEGEIIWQTPNTPNTPIRAYIKDPAGNMVKDFESTRQTSFQLLAQNAGRYTIVFQNNSIWYADYHLTYTVWGKPPQ